MNSQTRRVKRLMAAQQAREAAQWIEWYERQTPVTQRAFQRAAWPLAAKLKLLPSRETNPFDLPPAERAAYVACAEKMGCPPKASAQDHTAIYSFWQEFVSGNERN